VGVVQDVSAVEDFAVIVANGIFHGSHGEAIRAAKSVAIRARFF
jgi:hypothetical protein